MSASRPTEHSRRRRDLLVAAACGVFAAGMVGMAFAAVPLYDWFCRTTGFAGTPMLAKAAPANVLDRKVIVRLDANVAGGLPWRFMPEKSFVEVKVGDVLTVNYIVVNESAQRDRGQRDLQRVAADRRRLLLQDQLLLLHRAAPQARREARDAGGVLHRSEDRRRMPSTTV